MSLIYPYITKIDRYNNKIHQILVQHCNNTSISIGASNQEALIHCLNEWIEGDAYALFLIQNILKKEPTPIRLVNKQSMPSNLQLLIAEIEKTYEDEILVIDITTDINIPAFYVSFTKQKSVVQPIGLAASLFKETALEHALLEALQYKDTYNSNSEELKNAIIEQYKHKPMLLKAIKYDLVELVNSNQYVCTDWKNIICHSKIPLNEQISKINHLLMKKGCSIYSNTLYQSKNGISLCYVLITGLETFNLIKDGKFVPLKQRGLSALKGMGKWV